jgi:sulfate transport system substrate-binding protein
VNAEILRRHTDRLPPIDLFPVTILGKDWDDIRQRFFDDNGIFDTIYRPTANP